MSELRILLIVIGVLILGAIYYFGRRGEQEPVDYDDADPVPVDDEMAEELERLGRLITADRASGIEATKVKTGQQPAVRDSAIPRQPERIVSLFLKARSDALLRGVDITAAAEKVGLQYGDMQIYHRLHETDGRKVAVFSLANMMNPGTFELETITEMSTRGVCLFMPLPNPLSALDAWDSMLASGQRLADILNTDLVDETQSTLSRQRMMSVREEMREYDRKAELGIS